jgi:iron complex outermembrane receptor protein
MKSRMLHGASPWALAAAIAITAGTAHAQEVDRPQPQAEPQSGNEVAEVVVTGSLIRGTPEDAALPVDVIGSEELEKQGSPNIVDLIKNLPVSNGVLGDTNQFNPQAQGSEGSGSVNLRGLGPQRTLVLLNGRRMPVNPFGLGGAGIVDTNMIPTAAVGRIEILKDGAAATYGSDAIAGVVNFITRDGFDGLEIGGNYQFISGSDGDYSISAIAGKTFERGNILFSVGAQGRSELPVTERDFATRPYLDNPEGGWSAGGNPAVFVTAAGLVRDPQCATLGGYAGFAGAPGATTQRCYGHYVEYDNLVEEEARFQVFSSIDFELSDHHNFRAEALYGNTAVPQWKTSPSYLPLGSPSTANPAVANGNPVFGPLNGAYFVPGTNPGLIDFIAKNPTLNTVAGPLPSAALLGGGTSLAVGTWRPFLLGGNPLFGNGPSRGKRFYDSYRVSAGLDGDLTDFGLPGLNYDVSVTYGQETGYRSGYDSLTNRLALALQGFGGPNCDKQPNTPGIQNAAGVTIDATNAAANRGVNGCLYFNPFSNAIQQNAISGETNPQYNPALANSAELTNWFFKEGSTEQTARIFVADAVVSGETGLNLPGGPVQFAVGAQFRKDLFVSSYSDINNSQINPCVGTPDFFVTNCSGAARNGPLVFLGVGTSNDLDRSVYALFTELQLPVTEDFNVQLAARYEDYGGAVGSTFDPKISARWQINDYIALRGSAGSTFRGPPLIQLAPSQVTALSFIAGAFRAVDIGGNPNLEPESAQTYSAGVILDVGGFKGSVDYYRFDFENPIEAEALGGLVSALFPTGAPSNCGNPAYAAIEARFTFNGPCAAANIGRVQTFYTNTAPVKTSGVDFLGEYDFGDRFGGELSVGASATYVIEYKVAAQSLGGIVTQPAFEAVGFLNYQTTAYPLPQIKGSGYVEYERGDHNLRLTVNYMDEYEDQRTAPFAAGAFRDTAGNPVTNPNGKVIDSFITADLSYRALLPYDVTLTATVDNITDEDPPFARLDLSYDPFTANALGRTFKLGLRKQF